MNELKKKKKIGEQINILFCKYPNRFCFFDLTLCITFRTSYLLF